MGWQQWGKDGGNVIGVEICVMGLHLGLPHETPWLNASLSATRSNGCSHFYNRSKSTHCSKEWVKCIEKRCTTKGSDAFYAAKGKTALKFINANLK